MEYLFGLLALFILALLLLILPFGIQLKGRLLLLFLIAVVVMMGYLTHTILPFGETVGILFILVVAFTYLVHRRVGYLFESNEKMQVEVQDQVRLILPVREKALEELPFSFKASPNVIQTRADYLEEEIQKTADHYMENFVEDIDDKSQVVIADIDKTDFTEIPALNNQEFDEVDEDLNLLISRSTAGNDSQLEETFLPLINLTKEPEQIIRDLEAILANESPENLSGIEKVRELEERPEHSFNEFDVIEEIEVEPIKQSKGLAEQDEDGYTPFEMIEEIKHFNTDYDGKK